MEILYTIPLILLHLLTFMDAIKNRNGKNGIFRLFLALFPPIIGPVIYYLSKRNRTREFLKNEKRYAS
ncbi:hypothetical protein [Marinifilum caeruleilacunae]|uniref:Cardiolipin synthase N-terminal domain-containing protein n=1 Tax=Marinifilum caeruleilacunae TaxID=2499076 RepID=A0ABX1WXJ7_9BACT|nr:hypothetical protein [Marinifilum caeruleilacunae]NOU60767.1 hypothetical protein [Marinifilum caeruleilacunae]